MVELILRRLTGHYDRSPCIGVLYVAGKLCFTTLELPWMDNEKEKSCIPVNIYRCKRVDSPRFGLTFEVDDVPNRSQILFHQGNFPTDSKGCILLGTGFMPNEKGIADSEKAMTIFRQIVKQYSSAILTVKWV